MYLISLYLLTSCREDYSRGEGSTISINTPYNSYLFPISIVTSLFKASLLIEYLIKYSFSLPNSPNYKSLLVYIIGIFKKHVKFLNFLS